MDEGIKVTAICLTISLFC